MQELFKDASSFLDGTSEAYFKKGLCLPSPTSSTDNELMRVVKVIKDICH
jgi:UDP-N-acetylbacillosamine transaminase